MFYLFSPLRFSLSLPHSLDNELDLIDTQQLELDDVLTQLETNLSQYTPVLAEAQHADLERTRTLVNTLGNVNGMFSEAQFF